MENPKLYDCFAISVLVVWFFLITNDEYVTNVLRNNLIFLYDKFQKNNNKNENIQETVQSSELTQQREQERYENKYLEEIRKMSKEYILTNEEIEIKNVKYTEYYNEIISEYNEKINANVIKILKLSSEMEDIENMDQKKYINEDGEEYIFNYDGEKEFIKTTEEYKSEIEDLQKMIDKLCVEKNNVVDIQKRSEELAQKYIIKERLDKLSNCFVMEKTPLGNVLMMYKNETFEYYSDNAIPYRYLETVARKYIKLFNCRQIYVDMEEELKIYEEKLNKNTELNNKMDKKINNTKKNVFAKFKSYNKDGSGGRVNMVAPPKNNISTNLIPSENTNDKVILKENANHYKYQGKLSNFNILKKVDRKIVDKKYAMSFSDFKKTIMYQKIKN
jgi:hypothetical protein